MQPEDTGLRAVFDTPFHYESRWASPHCAQLTAYPRENAGWEDTAGGRVVLAELARRGLDRADVQISRVGDLILIAGPEHVVSGGDAVAVVSDVAGPAEIAEALCPVLDMTLANVARERMLIADGWRAGESLPAWALQTTPLLQALMASGGHTSTDLLHVEPPGRGRATRIVGSGMPGWAACDALPAEVEVSFNGASLLLAAGTGTFSLSQDDRTTLSLDRLDLRRDVGSDWAGRRVGELIGLGRGRLPGVLGECTIRDLSGCEADGVVVVTLSAPMVTIAPIPDHALAAVGMTDPPPGAAGYPLWTAVRRLPPRVPEAKTISIPADPRAAGGQPRSKGMVRKKSSGRALVAVNEPARDVVHHLAGSGEPIRVDAVFRVPAVHPKAPGPWSAEADKIAWVDPTSGYGCIIRRSPNKGYLCGYVAVDPDHPLYHWTAKALIGLHIQVHNGISYAEACEAGEPEEVSVCHPSGDGTSRVLPADFRQTVHRTAPGTDDAWWFGFHCDGPGDVLPLDPMHYAKGRQLDGVTERVYRDEAFVHHECTRLAAQLRAVADDRDPFEALAFRPSQADIGSDRAEG